MSFIGSNILVNNKINDEIDRKNKCGFYKIKCCNCNYVYEYIGKTYYYFNVRFKEPYMACKIRFAQYSNVQNRRLKLPLLEEYEILETVKKRKNLMNVQIYFKYSKTQNFY